MLHTESNTPKVFRDIGSDFKAVVVVTGMVFRLQEVRIPASVLFWSGAWDTHRIRIKGAYNSDSVLAKQEFSRQDRTACNRLTQEGA